MRTMQMIIFSSRALLFISGLLLIGCGANEFQVREELIDLPSSSSTEDPGPNPQETPVPSPSPGPVTPQPSPSPSPSPSPTPTPSPSPGPSPSPSPSPSPTPPPVSTTPEIQYFGRFDFSNAAAPRFSWSGSTVRARFKGSQVQVDLSAKSTGGGNTTQYFVAVVNNIAPKRFTVTGRQTVTLATGLGAGEHTVSVMRDTEGREAGVSFFHGFNFGNGAQLLPPAKFSNSLRLEVIGDSITCGFGNLGANASCPFSIATESAFYAYSQVAARTLGAQPATQLCMSGRGIVRSYGEGGSASKMTLPMAFNDTLSPGGNDVSLGVKWNFPTDPNKQPNVVLVNLGTNDYWNGSEPANYRSNYIQFASTIRSRYPNAYIFLAIGTMRYNPEAAIQYVVQQRKNAGDNKISYLRFAPQNAGIPNGVGCGSHPGSATHKIMADTLVDALRKIGF